MERRTLRNAAFAIVSLVAVGTTAATIQFLDSRGTGPGSASEGGAADPQPNPTPGPEEAFAMVPPDWLIGLVVFLFVAFTLAYFAFNLRQALALTALNALIAIVFIVAFEFSLDLMYPENASAPVRSPVQRNDSLALRGPDAVDRGEPTIPFQYIAGLAMVAVVAFAGVLVQLRRSVGSESGDEPDDVDDDGRSSEVAAAAGEAADRIESSHDSLDNEVYRTWVKMTRLLDVPHPESSTPGEFADAAVEGGLDRRDVAELRKLFEEVRYGDRDPEGREERAVETLRRIEASYETGDDEQDSERERSE